MRKLVNKLKGNKGGAKDNRSSYPHPDGGGVHREEDVSNSKFTVVDPGPVPTPAPRPYEETHGRDDLGQDDVGTFSGFGTWMASFEPDPNARGVAEVAAQPVDAAPSVAEVLSMEDGWPPRYILRLTLTGLKKSGSPSTLAVTIIGPWFMTLQQVNDLLARHGYDRIVSAKHGSRAPSNWDADKASPTDFEIPVIDGPSHYDSEARLGPLISRDEEVGVFLDNLRQLRVRCKEGKVVVTSFPAVLEIGFNRTLRLPEDGRVHNQAVRLGSIPINNIAGIAKKLEGSRNQSMMDMARKGGVFFPLYQREAMFLSFKARQDAFAVRVFVGGVNAVSGLPWNQRAQQQVATQDYLSVPPQQFLDGISVGRDIVKQFIAMPMGSGYSVEKQVTGKETVGGMQLEIVPGNRWVLQVPASPDLPQEGPYTPDYHDRPRMTGVTMMVLAENPSLKQTPDLSADTAADDELWAKENRPVYMHHLYKSQTSRLQYGQFSDPDPFCAGATVQMTAVYMLNLTLSYWDPKDGMYRVQPVIWAPWWTLEQCFSERRQAKFTVNGKSIDELELYHGAQMLPRNGTLGEQGIRDGDTVTIQTPAPVQGYQQGLSYHAGHHNANWFPDQDATSPYKPQDHQQTPYPGQDYMAHEMPTQYQGFQSQAGAVSPLQSYSPYQQTSPYSPSHQSYASPQQSYSSPQQSYSSPQQSYSSPQQSHASPQQSYSSPQQSYSSPQQSYAPAQQTYGQAAPVRPAYPQSSAPTSPPPRMSGSAPPGASAAPRPMAAPGPAAPASSYLPARYAPAAPPAASPPPQRYGSAAPASAAPSWAYASPQSSPPLSMASPSSPSAAFPSSIAPTSYVPQLQRLPSSVQGHSSYGSPPPRTSAPPSSAPAPSPRSEQDQTGWAMGIAAGTLIHQAIHRDPFTATAWAKRRATMLSVQILNSIAFESLTGMLAPSSPITAQMYIDQGLPFLASYDEGITTDGATHLAGIKSVGDLDAAGGTIPLGVNAAGGGKVGCTCCGRMLCDSIIRPCNHAFCSGCIATYMTHGPAVFCRICNTKATRLIGFSAPMALPGEDRVDLSVAKVITSQPYQGAMEFQSIYEMDGTTAASSQVYTHELQ